MSNVSRIFEVRVNIKGTKETEYYSSFLGKWVKNEIIKMFHLEAKSTKQAMKKAEKYGRPISARKTNMEKIQWNIEHLKLDQPLLNPYSNAIAMDEMIWKKKNNRIKNHTKDKRDIDNL